MSASEAPFPCIVVISLPDGIYLRRCYLERSRIDFRFPATAIPDKLELASFYRIQWSTHHFEAPPGICNRSYTTIGIFRGMGRELYTP